jgi:hypothetical protein
VTVNFAPQALGASTATLRIDTQTFTVSGTGNPPPALADYRFEGTSGVQEPLQQPGVGLQLSSPYPLTLTGTLTLAFNSEVFVTDPAVQFATGGRTINFTVPANTTRAIFANGAEQIRLQTGSVAGAITLAPSFATESGINLTPSSPASLTLTIPQSAPRITGVQITNRTANGFTLSVTGYATNRSVTQMEVQFTAFAGENLATTRIPINVESSFMAWYGSTQSQPFGSLFSITVPFTMSGDATNVSSLIDTLQAVSVTLTNRQGTSQAQRVDFR